MNPFEYPYIENVKGKDLKTSVMSRSAKLFGMASQLAGSELSQGIKSKLLSNYEHFQSFLVDLLGTALSSKMVNKA